MRPSSSGSDPDLEPAAPGLFDAVLARGRARRAMDDDAWLGAMLRYEGALARALARAGRIPSAHAAAIEAACRPESFDVGQLGRDAAASGTPVAPLVRALAEAVGGEAAGSVHLGATSQDVMDTAAMLVARRAIVPILADLTAASEAAAGLARAHRTTPIAGRTLLQWAAPTTFGLKAAGWMTALDAAVERLDEVARTGLAVQLGGAVGTLAALGADGLTVRAYLAAELDLPEPVLPWHTDRTRIAGVAVALGIAAGSLGKVALDATLLAQGEVDEAADVTPGRGGSSTLPQKRNPIAAVSALACARQAPGLVATLLAAMPQEHERAAGAWHAEWRPFRELFVAVGSAAAWVRDLLGHLEVDPARMRDHLDASGGLLMAERVSVELARVTGLPTARRLVAAGATEAARTGRTFLDVLASREEIARVLGRDDLARLLDPAEYLGSAGELVDRALRAHEAQGGGVSG